MAEEIVGLKVKVDASEATKSLGQVRKEIKQANSDLIAAQKQFGDYSAEAIAAAKKVAQLKDSIQEARETADLFDPGKKFQVFAGALSAVAGGFSAVQGAIGLLGVESEEVEKSILKVQSALALSQGLSTVADSAKDFQRLGAVVKTQVVNAFSTLRGAIIATGIGALAVGVGLLIANFETVKKVVLNFIPGLGKLADFVGNLVNKVTDFVGITSEAGRATAKVIAENQKAIESTERFLSLNADKYDEYTQRKIKANLEYKKAENEFLNDQKLSETQKNLFIKQAREKANREIARADTDRNNAAKEANQKYIDGQNEIAEKQKALAQERREREYNDFVEHVNTLQAETNAEIELLNFLVEEQKRKEQELFDWQVQLAQDKYDSEEAGFALMEELNKKSIENEQKALDAKIAIQMAEIDLVMQLSGVLRQVAGNNKAIQTAAIIAENAAGIGRIIINTQVANAKALALSPGTFGQPFVTINKVSAALGIASSLLATRKALSSLGGGGSAGTAPTLNTVGGSAPIAPTEPTAQLTQLNQASINQMGSAAGRAYVVESDITNQQEKIVRINRAARLG
jgi:hypothetical protein